MPFLKNAWYAAGFAEDLGAVPISRRICNELVVIFRDAGGKASILQDRCPHRFVPLSKGKVEANGLRCGYHGLLFDGTGNCVELPNDERGMRQDIRVRAYPTQERHGVIWVWMGEPARANPDTIPDFSYITAKNYRTICGYTHTKANYELITDNLLDLSHVHYLHPDAKPGNEFQNFENRVKQEGTTVWSMLWKTGFVPAPFQRSMWGSKSPRGDGISHTRWDPPSLLMINNALAEEGLPPEEGLRIPSGHLLTPETEFSTHYFWAIGRTSRLDDTQLDEQLRTLGNKLFDEEDGPMIAAQQEAMGETTDFLTQKPLILKADAAGVRARLVLKKLINAEQGLETARSELQPA